MSDSKPAVNEPCYPVEVRRQSADSAMRITWHDGHVSDYPWAYVRGWCPCAGCQGHGNEKRYIHSDNPQLTNISIVGKYALSLIWADGHDTGIYSYRYLREMCPCPTCSSTPGE